MDCAAGGLGNLAKGFVWYAMANNPVSNIVTSYPFCRVIEGVAQTTPSVMQARCCRQDVEHRCERHLR